MLLVFKGSQYGTQNRFRLILNRFCKSFVLLVIEAQALKYKVEDGSSYFINNLAQIFIRNSLRERENKKLPCFLLMYGSSSSSQMSRIMIKLLLKWKEGISL